MHSGCAQGNQSGSRGARSADRAGVPARVRPSPTPRRRSTPASTPEAPRAGPSQGARTRAPIRLSRPVRRGTDRGPAVRREVHGRYSRRRRRRRSSPTTLRAPARAPQRPGAEGRGGAPPTRLWWDAGGRVAFGFRRDGLRLSEDPAARLSARRRRRSPPTRSAGGAAAAASVPLAFGSAAGLAGGDRGPDKVCSRPARSGD